MKKIFLIVIMGLLLAGLTGAMLYNSKQEALTYKATRKIEIENYLKSIPDLKITYISNGECSQKIESNETICGVKYYVGDNYDEEDFEINSEYITYPEGSTKEDIDNLIRAKETQKLENAYKNEKVQWVDISLKDVEIRLKVEDLKEE